METAVLEIEGMTCERCSRSVRSALEAIPGVTWVEVSLPSGEAAVRYDAFKVQPSQLRVAVGAVGFTARSITLTAAVA